MGHGLLPATRQARRVTSLVVCVDVDSCAEACEGTTKLKKRLLMQSRAD